MSIDVPRGGSNGSDTGCSPQSLVCPKCREKYSSLHELLTHQGSAKHFACDKCNVCFWTEEDLRDHKRKNHRPELDLECFGCQTHFTRAALFWHHFENNECKVIYYSDIAKLRHRNLEFAKQLDLRKLTLSDIIRNEESHIKGDNTWASYNEGDTAPAETPVAAPNFPSRPAPISTSSAHPLYYRSEDFPLLPTGKKSPVVSSPSGGQKKNIWINNKATISRVSSGIQNSYNAVPPPASYDGPSANIFKGAIQDLTPNKTIRAIQSPKNPAGGGPHATTSGGRILDPDHPDYNPAVFHNEILETFVCPYKSCGKKFRNAFGITQHLRSPAHAGGRITCISCHKIFATVSDLIGHMETATKCRIRETDGFPSALGQITGGIMGFDTRSGSFFISERSAKELLNAHSEATKNN